MTVLIADSSAQVTLRLKNIIETKNDTAVIYCARTFEKALSTFKEHKPAVVLIGMNLPGNGSIDLMQAIKSTCHFTNIIILSIDDNKPLIEQCRLMGANIFLDKFLEFDKIPEIINSIAKKN